MTFIPRTSPKYQAPTHLVDVVAKLEAFQTAPFQFAFSVPPRHGKALADATPILTRRGWTTVGEVRPGDFLVGRDGAWTEVLGVFPQGEVALRRVSFSDGASLVTCAEHRWEAQQRYPGGRDGLSPTPKRVLTTAQFEADLTEADGRLKWRIPVAAPWLGEAASLPLDPYLLGVWLGDGTSRRGEVTSADPEISTAFRAAGFETSYQYPAGAATTHGIPGLVTILKSLGVLGKGLKHIPESYLGADIASRLSLLQGLCDTDGTVAKNGSQQTFTSTCEALARDFKQLVSSLGGTWTEYARPAAGKTAHTISFRLPLGMAGFRLHRKASRLAPHGPRNTPRRFVRRVEEAGRGLATCFTVAAQDHLFCAGRDFVVSHNTELILHFIAWALLKDPSLNICYVTYNKDQALSKSRRALSIARAAGVELVRCTAGEWATPENEHILFTGVGGSVTGKGFNLIIIDDPHKNRAEAESTTYRNHAWDFFQSDLYTRLEPGGSIIDIQTRWHEADLAGRLTQDNPEEEWEAWDFVNLPAIANEGHEGAEVALWPSRWPLDNLKKRRAIVGPYAWASLFQGQPRPRGTTVFGPPSYYTQLPESFRIGQGLDLAYTQKKTADFSVIVTMLRSGEDYYIRRVVRRQLRAPEFKEELRRERARYPNSQCRIYAAGVELGATDFLQEPERQGGRITRPGITLEVMAPEGDKFTRSIPFAAAWNAGHVHLPDPSLIEKEPTEYGWVDKYLSELLAFTGVNDAKDDQIDASAPAFDVLAVTQTGYRRVKDEGNSRRM